MSVSTENTLTYAFELVNQEAASEVILRNAVGRAYYAAFNHTETLHSVIPHYLDGPKTGLHQQKINQLKSVIVASDIGVTAEVVKSFRKLGMVLADIRSKRTLADYHLNETLNLETALLACKQARQFIDGCDAVMNAVNPTPLAEPQPA